MEWTEALNRTIACAEAHLRSRLTVADLANAAGVSAFHLQRGFRIIMGFSLGEYVRNRRLYCAALEIANTERSILDIALDFQYETAESFTKAFSRFHGSTPSQVRSAGAKKSALPVVPFLPVTISIHVTGGNKMDYCNTQRKNRIFATITAPQKITLCANVLHIAFSFPTPTSGVRV